MKNVYLGLAVLGAVVPYLFFVQHFAAAGLSLLAFIAAGFANPGASGLTADLLLSSVVFWVYLFAAGDGRRAALLIPVNLLIGLSCALPLYLYLRARGPAPAPAAATPRDGSLHAG
jgi:hypothetical protein